MISMRTLGTVDLVDGEGVRIDALLSRPKRLALLAYLAAARADGTYRREKLLALFWPEADEALARSSLRQSMHVLRQHLGPDAVHAIGDEQVTLSRAVLRCDAVDFERALSEGRLEDALALYEGDFLPGVFLDGAEEFDAWVESVRTRLRDCASSAAMKLADQAWRSGQYAACSEAAKRAIAITPSDERATRRLMGACDRLGNRAGAIIAYDALVQRLRADLDVSPSAETQALVAAVRLRDHATPPPADADEPMQPPPLTVATPRPHLVPARASVGSARFGRRMMTGALAVGVLALSGSRPQLKTPAVPHSMPAEARADYERGRFYLEKPSEGNLRKAVTHFGQALDVEPLSAAANAGLGDAYLRLGYGSYLAPSDAFPKAIAAARRAIQLDSLAPEAHATLAFARMYYDWDWAGAEREFRVAIRIAPEYVLAHEWFAYLLVATHRDAEARREIDIAQRLAPLSVAAAVDGGFVSFYADDLPEARRRLEGALLMAPEVPAAHLWLGRVEQRDNHLLRAREQFQASGALKDWVPTVAALAYVDAQLGNRPSARAALVRLDSIGKERYVTPYAVALVHAALGDRDEAFHWLDKAVTDRSHWLVWLERDSRWAPIRSDARFATLLRRVGLPR